RRQLSRQVPMKLEISGVDRSNSCLPKAAANTICRVFAGELGNPPLLARARVRGEHLMTDGVKRTVVAQQAIDLGELLNFRFEHRHVGRDAPKRLSVITLASQSTGGGKLARQSVVLTPLEEG